MAFPTVASLTETTVASMTTTHNISLGATVNAGDLLLMIFVGSQVGADQLYTITKPTGFKRIWDRQYDLAAQNRQHVAVFAKKAVGDEDGTTVNVATSASVSAVAHVYRIASGTWFGDLKAIACSPYTQAEAANPNPASLTVPWGSADNLWLAIAAWEDSDFFASAAPTNYTDLTTEIADSTEDAVISSARRENAVATEDPGTFTAASEKNLALTIGIAPSGATMPTFPPTPTVANGRLLFTLNTAGGATRTFPSLSNLLKSEGDLLVAVVVTYDGNSTNAEFSGWGGGFQEFKDQATPTTMGIGLAYKFSDGAETGTFTVTTADTSTTDSVLMIMSFPWAHDSTPPEAGDIANGTTSGADAPSLSPSWGAENTKWVWVGGVGETATGGSFTGITLPPSNWITTQFSGITADVVGGVEAAVAFRELNASSADAGAAASVDTSNTRNSALLFAVRPFPAAPPPTDIDSVPGVAVGLGIPQLVEVLRTVFARPGVAIGLAVAPEVSLGAPVSITSVPGIGIGLASPPDVSAGLNLHSPPGVALGLSVLSTVAENVTISPNPAFGIVAASSPTVSTALVTSIDARPGLAIGLSRPSSVTVEVNVSIASRPGLGMAFAPAPAVTTAGVVAVDATPALGLALSPAPVVSATLVTFVDTPPGAAIGLASRPTVTAEALIFIASRPGLGIAISPAPDVVAVVGSISIVSHAGLGIAFAAAPVVTGIFYSTDVIVGGQVGGGTLVGTRVSGNNTHPTSVGEATGVIKVRGSTGRSKVGR